MIVVIVILCTICFFSTYGRIGRILARLQSRTDGLWNCSCSLEYSPSILTEFRRWDTPRNYRVCFSFSVFFVLIIIWISQLSHHSGSLFGHNSQKSGYHRSIFSGFLFILKIFFLMNWQCINILFRYIFEISQESQ